MLSLKKVKAAAEVLKRTSAKQRNQVLLEMVRLLKSQEKKILSENQKDLNALPANHNSAFRDRLTLNSRRLTQMGESLILVSREPDPLGPTDKIKILKNKLKLKKIRSPLGVIFMIFESRPNVAIEAFSIGFKAGNAMILRGGKESQHTTKCLYAIIQQALKKYKLPTESVWGITDPSREIVNDLLKQNQFIDVVVPRGGEHLIEHVSQNTTIPIIKNDRGLCHIYVHKDADLKMAVEILVNAKTQRPSVCNSMETMLIHKSVATKLLPQVYVKMQEFGVQWHVCRETQKILAQAKIASNDIQLATDKDWNTEYLDQQVNCKIVASDTEALERIAKFGSRHSESIITKNKKTAENFQLFIDAAVVYWNASTRFTDGFEFGLGGELGISTQKLHVRGPVGLSALTSVRWIVDGQGQIRK
jgi:glutamate-5-semialdehyde dehydrogenase